MRMCNIRVFLVAVLLTGMVFPGCFQRRTADLVLMHGKVVTVDENLPEAQAIAVQGDRILAVGSDQEIQRYIRRQTKVIDLNGALAIPGFIDGHAHFMGLGRAKMQLDLTRAKNWDEIVAMVAEAAKKARPGEWITGRGWHQEKWDRPPKPNVGGLPYHDKLSAVSPDNPVMLTHASGHSCIANAKAMELAGVTDTTANPPGGEIVRDARGRAIGVFRETAQGLISAAMQRSRARRTPEQIEAERRKMVRLAVRECLSKGITSFHDAGESFEMIDFLKKMADEGELSIRLYVMVRAGNDALREHLKEYKIVGYGNNHLTVRAVKEYMDGALGSHGAWLLEPYADLPTNTGLNVTP
ncbi:MAG TPA: amidohydrolase, partial [Bacteroidetes bacterium]|nr:amidohydrolase [Bacteroidota bacterium]